MNHQFLKEIIVNQHRKRKLPKKMVKREKFNYQKACNSAHFIHVVTGIRRCGKSTLLELIRQQQADKDYYLNFDDDRLINFQVQDFQTLYEVFLELFGEQNTFYFDEIQNIEGWERFVRRLFDEGKKVYVTGSNAQLLSRELGTRLTGRYTQTELYPFSFKEYLKFKKAAPCLLDQLDTEEKVRLKRHFSDYLKQGGFPEYLHTKNTDYLRQLYWNLIYKDIVVRYHLPNDKPVKELALYLASNIGKPVSFNKLKTHLGAGSATTVKEYLDYFENGYLFFAINKYDFSLKKQLYNPKKVYCIDTHLAGQIGFRFSQEAGRYLENAVFLQLKRQGHDIYYHQAKKECDFLIRQGLKITAALQVTASLANPDTRMRELDGLKEAMDSYKLKEGLVLTEGEAGELKYGRKIIRIMPVWKWMLR